MNKLVIALSIIVVVLLALIVITINNEEEVIEVTPSPIEKELTELKQTFDSCETNDRGEWCCKEVWSGDRMIERECRQFKQ